MLPLPSLSSAQLSDLAARGIRVPSYDRSVVQTGIVHFGPGAFHRVHQAWYADRALVSDPRWGICEVALQTPHVRDALQPQHGLYTLGVLDELCEWIIVGAIRELRVARESPADVIRRLSDPRVHLVTATVTEKGYCLNADGALDRNHPDIAFDLAHPYTPRSLIGFLVAGLAERRARGLAPPTIVSCDNLTDNGARLKRGVLDFCRALDPSLAHWVDAQVAFPSSMVDSITPATDDALREHVANELGIVDRWPVQRERFTQWVIEDDLRGPQPDWHAMGVTITDDVRGFERAKLRLLNGAHSTLAYLGALAGHETVAQAVSDTALSRFVNRMMREDIVPTLATPRGLHVEEYLESILRRFRNPAIRHLLAQIAWDGSQKIPFRLLGTITDRLQQGARIDRLALPIAAWMHFIRRKALRGERATDPLADELLAIGASTSGAADDVAAFLGLSRMFPPALTAQSAFAEAVRAAYMRLGEVSSPDTLAKALSA